MQSGCKIYLPRIVENLEWLAALKAFDGDFRRLCRRLSEHWEGVPFLIDDAVTPNFSLSQSLPKWPVSP